MPCEAMVCAALGGLAILLLELAELRNLSPDQRPDLKDPVYWFPYVLLPLIGAGMAYVYERSGIHLTPLLAANVGVSAPLIVRSMAQANPFAGRIDPGKGA